MAGMLGFCLRQAQFIIDCDIKSQVLCYVDPE